MLYVLNFVEQYNYFLRIALITFHVVVYNYFRVSRLYKGFLEFVKVSFGLHWKVDGGVLGR
ncbi:protein TWIN LOV 1 [Iris pallida]|uniref:Protein TWIN LOV 1 n=1 Tax=Iris pallida TaxID=29817 RepID=A0AAX6DR42_IRIPA|nr:protein TWIN LOV 1 [Iris pallida]